MGRAFTVVAASAATVLLGAAPAAAASATLNDPAGDATRTGLDITRAVLTNGPRTVTARVTFTRVTRGDVIVSVDRREGAGVRMVSEYRHGREPQNTVLRGAFTDEGVGGRIACPGFRVSWDKQGRSVTMRMPSSCLNGGRYGDLRFAVLTEDDGADSDVAPQTRRGDIGSSRWIARG